MNKETLEALLEEYRSGKVDTATVVHEILKHVVYEDLTENIDGLRELRKGFPETVFCLRKTPEQVVRAFKKVYEAYGKALGTKATNEHFEAVSQHFSEVEFYPQSGVIKLGETKEKSGYVPVIAAGSSDYPVVEEAYLTLDFLGTRSDMVIDVGVAGIHRLSKVLEHLEKANCVVVVAGMEGALPSLIAGLSPVPVIGVPTSVGYGTSFAGIAPLLTMLNSCAEGLAVVNIDNGFGAAVIAHMINILAERGKDR